MERSILACIKYAYIRHRYTRYGDPNYEIRYPAKSTDFDDVFHGSVAPVVGPPRSDAFICGKHRSIHENIHYMHRANSNNKSAILCIHPELTYNIIKMYPYVDWDYGSLLQHAPFTYDEVMNLYECGLFDKETLSQYSGNRYLTYSTIAAHPEFPWIMDMYIMNPNTSVYAKLKHSETLGIGSDGAYSINDVLDIGRLKYLQIKKLRSIHHFGPAYDVDASYDMRPKDLISHSTDELRQLWADFDQMSRANMCIYISHLITTGSDILTRDQLIRAVKECGRYEWPNIPLTFILANRDFNWYYEAIYPRRDISIHALIDNLDTLPHMPYLMSIISGKHDLTLAIVSAYRNTVDWDYSIVTTHPNITYRDILSRSDIPWDYALVSGNPNMSAADLVHLKQSDRFQMPDTSLKTYLESDMLWRRYWQRDRARRQAEFMRRFLDHVHPVATSNVARLAMQFIGYI
jgi:hypothetical protein